MEQQEKQRNLKWSMQSTKRVARGYSTMNSLSCLQEIVRFSILTANMEELPTESATIEIQEGKG